MDTTNQRVMGQIVHTSTDHTKENSIRVRLKSDGMEYNYQHANVKTETGLCGLYDLAAKYLVGQKCIEMGITSEYSRTLPVIVRAALEDMRKKLPADKISSTKEFLTRLIDFVEMNKLKSNFKTSKMRLAYVDCLKSNLPGNRFSDLETLVYLVDMIPD